MSIAHAPIASRTQPFRRRRSRFRARKQRIGIEAQPNFISPKDSRRERPVQADDGRERAKGDFLHRADGVDAKEKRHDRMPVIGEIDDLDGERRRRIEAACRRRHRLRQKRAEREHGPRGIDRAEDAARVCTRGMANVVPAASIQSTFTSAPSAGTTTVALRPRPRSLESWMVPPRRCTAASVRSRPTPRPLRRSALFRIVKPGKKRNENSVRSGNVSPMSARTAPFSIARRRTSSGSTPRPSTATTTRRDPARSSARSSSVPRGGLRCCVRTSGSSKPCAIAFRASLDDRIGERLG